MWRDPAYYNVPYLKPLYEFMEYKNWKEYIKHKFEGDEFIFDDRTGEKISYLDIRSTVSTCKISFIWPNKEWTEIDDVQYYSLETQAWSGESIGPNPKKFGKLSPDNIKLIDNFLKIPLEIGWIGEELKLFGKTIKRTSYVRTEQKSRILTEYGGELGCLSHLFLLPILWLVNWLIKLEIIGTRKLIIVEPMKSNA